LRKSVFVALTVASVLALAFLWPASLRYPAASLGVVVRAAGGDPDMARAEKAWRAEVADPNVTPLTLLHDVLGWDPEVAK
jgi:hypothetical protein